MKTYTFITLLSIGLLMGCTKSTSQDTAAENPNTNTHTFSENVNISRGLLLQSIKIKDTMKCLTAVVSIPDTPIEEFAPFVKIAQDTSEALLKRFTKSIPTVLGDCKQQYIVEVFPVFTALKQGLISSCYKVYVKTENHPALEHFQSLNYLLSEQRLLHAAELFKPGKEKELLRKINSRLPSTIPPLESMETIDVNIEFDSLCFNIPFSRDSQPTSTFRMKFFLPDMAPFCKYDFATPTSSN